MQDQANAEIKKKVELLDITDRQEKEKLEKYTSMMTKVEEELKALEK